MEGERAVAVGRLVPDGAWVGFAETAAGYRLAFGHSAGLVVDAAGVATSRRDLLSVALLYFGDATEPGPEHLAATHRDVGDLVRWLAGTAADDETARRLRLAVDAIDDGLAADAVMLRLEDAAAALSEGSDDGAADPLDRLTRRYRELSTVR